MYYQEGNDRAMQALEVKSKTPSLGPLPLQSPQLPVFSIDKADKSLPASFFLLQNSTQLGRRRCECFMQYLLELLGYSRSQWSYYILPDEDRVQPEGVLEGLLLEGLLLVEGGLGVAIARELLFSALAIEASLSCRAERVRVPQRRVSTRIWV